MAFQRAPRLKTDNPHHKSSKTPFRRAVSGGGSPSFVLADPRGSAEFEADRLSRESGASIAESAWQSQATVTEHEGGRTLGSRSSEQLASYLDQGPSQGAPLSPTLARQLPSSVWSKLSGVNVHTGPVPTSLTSSLQTPAFAVGQDIFLSSRLSTSSNPPLAQVLRHEAVHTAQAAARPRTSPEVIHCFGDPTFAAGVQNYWALEHVHEWLEMDTETVTGIIGRMTDSVEVYQHLDAVENYRINPHLDDQERQQVEFKLLVFRNSLTNRLTTIEDTPMGEPIPDEPTPSSSPAIEDAELSDKDRAFITAATDLVTLSGTERALLDRDFVREMDEATSGDQSTRKKERQLQKTFEGWQDKLVNDPRAEAKAPIDEIKNAREKSSTKANELIEQYGDLDTLEANYSSVKADTAEVLFRMTKAVIEKELALHQETPASWFAGIVPGATFLGLQIQKSDNSVSPGVHRVFLERLRAAESILMNKAGLGSPREAADFYGITKITGLRQPKLSNKGTVPSLHAYGLAVDINGANNPYIQDTQEDLIIQHATQLILGRTIKLIKKKDDMSVSEILSEMKVVEDALHKYFALEGTEESGTHYEDSSQETPFAAAVREHGGDRSFDDWKRDFKKDLKESRPNSSRDIKNVRKPGGTLVNFKLTFIESMIEADISWGGTKTKPDIMHFDYRKSKLGMAGR